MPSEDGCSRREKELMRRRVSGSGLARIATPAEPRESVGAELVDSARITRANVVVVGPNHHFTYPTKWAVYEL